MSSVPKKKCKVQDSTQDAGSYNVQDFTTKFQNDVMTQLREWAEWLGLNRDLYSSMGGLSLLTIIVVQESELTKFVNLTDMQVISLLKDQRERLKTKMPLLHVQV